MNPREYLNSLQTRIDELSLRERAILFFTVSLLLYLAVSALLLTPLEKQQQQLLDSTRAVHGEIAILDQQIVGLIESSKQDPDQEARQQLAQLEGRSEQLQQRIREAISGLIEPPQMARALEKVLAEQRGLRFVRIENLPPQPLLEEHASGDSAVYRHTLLMEMEGDFRSALAYLQALEALEWQLRWDEVSLLTLEYPRTRIQFKVHTLSMHRGWLGV